MEASYGTAYLKRSCHDGGHVHAEVVHPEEHGRSDSEHADTDKLGEGDAR